MRDLRFVWLEITEKCQLACNHCYAESGPTGRDGAMLPADWCRVIDEVAQLGGRMVQFIGGEPTLYQGFPDLVQRALDQGLEVEVLTNLVHVSRELWETFAHRGLRLATPAEYRSALRALRPGEGRGVAEWRCVAMCVRALDASRQYPAEHPDRDPDRSGDGLRDRDAGRPLPGAGDAVCAEDV